MPCSDDRREVTTTGGFNVMAVHNNHASCHCRSAMLMIVVQSLHQCSSSALITVRRVHQHQWWLMPHHALSSIMIVACQQVLTCSSSPGQLPAISGMMPCSALNSGAFCAIRRQMLCTSSCRQPGAGLRVVSNLLQPCDERHTLHPLKLHR